MHGIGRFISASDLFGLSENAGNTRLEPILLEKSYGASFVLAQPGISMDLASHSVCNGLRGLDCLWLWARK